VVGIPGDQISRGTWSILVWAVNNYGFLLPDGESSWAEFAALVRHHYDLGNEVNLSVYYAMIEAREGVDHE
jgi:hypothetical protein